VPFFFVAVERSRRELELTVGRMARSALGEDLNAARYIVRGLW